MELRQYQINDINNIRKAYKDGFKAPILVAPCGAGKSSEAAYIAKRATDQGNRVLFMVHRIEIVRQIVDTFTTWGVNLDLCDIGMVQTFTRRIDKIETPSLIITDEDHHGVSTTYKRIYEAFPDALRIGFTATPCRLDGKPLSEICDIIIESVDAKWLIDNNYLAPYQYYAPQLADFTGLKRRAGDYETETQAAILSKPKIFGDVIAHYLKLADGKKAICYSPTIKHSMEMCEAFNDAGIPAAHIDGTTPAENRKQTMEAFRVGDIQILCNNEIIAEGVSVDDCEVCILLRKTSSLTLFIQQSMRCMRYMPGKTAIIIDHVGNYLQHGLPDDKRYWSLDKKLPEPRKYNTDGTLKVRQCPHCFHTFKTASICPNCGEPYAKTKEEIQQIKNVELQEIKQRKQTQQDRYRAAVALTVSEYTSEKQCRNMSELQAYAKLTGRKPGWAYFIAKNRGII